MTTNGNHLMLPAPRQFIDDDDEKQPRIGPLNGLRLGVVLSESAKSLAELNAVAEDDAEEDDFPCADGG